MLNKLHSFIRSNRLVEKGDTVICAVSGGADSVALLFALHLLAPKLGITLQAAHFNHHLRGAESDRDAAFVADLCAGYSIPLHMGEGHVVPSEKGLEAAARDARYSFLMSLPGKIATAHTADDNAETVLMHLVRGTGLKGLGGIAPVRDRLIRPMLSITRREIMDFLGEYHLSYVNDSSNDTDDFLRNRLRHRVMPWLREENPRFAENTSAMALRLRADEAAISQTVAKDRVCQVDYLRQLSDAQRTRALTVFLESCGVREPSAEHIGLLQALVFSQKPSAKACLPGGVTVRRNYGLLEKDTPVAPLETQYLECPGTWELPAQNVRIVCTPTEDFFDQADCFTVCPEGRLSVRARQAGDTMGMPGGTKKLKELFVDAKIPAPRRCQIPVIADDQGVLGVMGFGPNRNRKDQLSPRILVRFEKIR